MGCKFNSRLNPIFCGHAPACLPDYHCLLRLLSEDSNWQDMHFCVLTCGVGRNVILVNFDFTLLYTLIIFGNLGPFFDKLFQSKLAMYYSTILNKSTIMNKTQEHCMNGVFYHTTWSERFGTIIYILILVYNGQWCNCVVTVYMYIVLQYTCRKTQEPTPVHIICLLFVRMSATVPAVVVWFVRRFF